ncbi:MAG: methyltransferase domain-containing protein [Actinobacteria bacterium]|nr:methyltransferase domain-containing protein [Actinomycetota bacterium]
MKAYYDRRAPEYDDWWRGTGRHADKPDRPGWAAEVEQLLGVLEDLEPARVLDVACGTGFLTQQLRGDVVGLDQSPKMLAIARERVPTARFIRGEALQLPFEDGAFDRVVTAHFYGHLEPAERGRFLHEARRVAGELVVVDSAMRDGVEPEAMQERVLEDGSRWSVLKRYFGAAELAAELGGGEVLLDGDWFVVVQA